MAMRQKIHLFFCNMETHGSRKLKWQRVQLVQVPKGRRVLNPRKDGLDERKSIMPIAVSCRSLKSVCMVYTWWKY